MIRNLIFGVFCVLILIVSFTMTYYMSLEEKENEVKVMEFEEIEKDSECNNAKGNYLMYSFCFKLFAAFFAGGIFSDGVFIRMGVI